MNDRSRILKALIFPAAWSLRSTSTSPTAHAVFDLTASAQAAGSGQIDLTALSGGPGQLGFIGFTDVAGIDTRSADPVIDGFGTNDPVPGPDVVLPTRESCEAAREHVITIAAKLEAGRMSTWAHTMSLEPPAEYRVRIHGRPAPSALESLEKSDFSPEYEVLPSMPIRRREIMGA